MALRTIRRLRPVAFTMRPTETPNRDPNFGRRQIGLLAENVAAVDARMAIYEDDGVTPKSYRQEAMIALLVKAIQEQQREIAHLRTQLKALDGRVSASEYTDFKWSGKRPPLTAAAGADRP